jgi:predicted dehydrogenase
MKRSDHLVRLGVVGLGFIGHRHVATIERCEGVVLSALVEPNEQRRLELARAGVPAFSRVDDMLGRAELDGVIIATPSHLHADPTVACLQAGLHVLVEKPIATAIEDADRIVEAARRHQRHVLVGYNRRHSEVVEQTKDLLSHAIGDLAAVNGQWTVKKPGTYFQPDWRRVRAAGPTMINLTHDIDLLRHFCGDIESISALGTNRVRQFEKEDVVAIALRFRHGILGTFLLSDSLHSPWAWELATGESEEFKATWQNNYRFMGTEGSLEFPNLVLWASSSRDPSWMNPIEEKVISSRRGDTFLAQIRHFRDVVAGLGVPLVSAFDARETLRATLAVQQSILSEGEVRL